ncbi:MAG: CotH kinase family protein, partial [Verrucomicrobia bacterium]|nr:CotH kinase family protein [Verrucomicrobiota bacterium]
QAADGRAPAGWPASWGANVVNYGMDPDIVNAPAYRDELLPAMKSLPSFVVVTELKHLFDAATGIYANPGNDGRTWERPTSLELIFPDGREGFQVNCGIRIRGGFSRSTDNPKHALRFFFRDEYGAGKLRFPLFGNDGADTFDNMDLRTFQNYSWSFQGDNRGVFIRDQFNRDSQLAMGQQGERGEYYHLFINGQYWGIYNTCERPEASYGETYFGGDKEDFDVIKVEAGPYTINPTDGNQVAWNELYNLCRAGITNDAVYLKLQGLNPDGTPNPTYRNLLDVDNLIDYMLVIYFGGNLDAPISNFLGNTSPNNFYGMRDRTGRSGGFKYFVHDAEHTLLDVNENRTGPFSSGSSSVSKSNPQYFFQRLAANPEFRLRVADRIHRHFFNNGVLTPAASQERFGRR